MQKPAYSRLIIVLICGIFAVSTASILIRFALDAGVPALVVAAYRLTFATLILTPIILRGHSAELRHRMSLLTYIYLVYGMAALMLIGLAALSGASFTQLPNGEPYPVSVFVWLLLLAILPQLVGHSSYNYALRFLPPTYVAIVALAEPIGASLLALVLLHEVPLPLTIAGAIVILIGIGVASRPARTRELSHAE